MTGVQTCALPIYPTLDATALSACDPNHMHMATITMSWTGPQSVCSCGYYEVYYKVGTYISPTVNVGSATTYTFDNLALNLTHYCYVRWHCATGTRASSWKLKSKKTVTGCRMDDGLSGDEQIIPTLDIYPNPAANLANIAYNFKNGGNVTVNIVNMMGQVVYQSANLENYGSDELNVNTSDFANGVYFVTVKQDDGEVLTQKLVINK